MQTRQIYNILHKRTNIHGDNPRNSLQYHIVKKYEDPAQSIRSRELLSGLARKKQKQLKRGHYLEDQYAMTKNIPGPGTYQVSSQLSQSFSRKKVKSDKKTYLDQVISKSNKQKYPGPGKYEVLKQIGADSVKPISSQKRIQTQKIDYLDNAEYIGTLTPGVGQYDVNRYQRSITEKKLSKIKRNPQFWKQKHRQNSLKVLPQAPQPATYNPKTIQYELFTQKSKTKQFLDFEKFKQKKRIKTQAKGSNIGPGKYDIIHQWKKSHKNQKGLLDNISKGISKRVYY